jgi:hypothetical protein
MVTLCPVKVIVIVLVSGVDIGKLGGVVPGIVGCTLLPSWSWVNPNVRVFPLAVEDIPTEIAPGLPDGIVKLIRIGPG